jgi:ribosome-associated protein
MNTINKDKTKELFTELALKCAKVLDDRKAEDIILLDVSDTTPLADFFLIASAESYLQIKVLSDYVEEELLKDKYKRINPKNPFEETPWLLSDFGFIVVHLFTKEAREYYNIEKFWHDAKKLYPETISE